MRYSTIAVADALHFLHRIALIAFMDCWHEPQASPRGEAAPGRRYSAAPDRQARTAFFRKNVVLQVRKKRQMRREIVLLRYIRRAMY